MVLIMPGREVRPETKKTVAATKRIKLARKPIERK
jgi:hypothetical protein